MTCHYMDFFTPLVSTSCHALSSFILARYGSEGTLLDHISTSLKTLRHWGAKIISTYSLKNILPGTYAAEKDLGVWIYLYAQNHAHQQTTWIHQEKHEVHSCNRSKMQTVNL